MIILNCAGQKKKVYTTHLHIYYLGDTSIHMPCNCQIPGYTPDSSGCLGADSVEIAIYKYNTLIEKFYSDKNGNCPLFNLSTGGNTIKLSINGKVTDTAQIDFNNPGVMLLSKNDTVPGLFSPTISFSHKITNNIYNCCFWLKPARKSGVKMVPKKVEN